jgi:low temperature requirement protein LtrA
VTAPVAGDLTGNGAARGLVVLGLLWWAWTAWAWLGNVAVADHGVVRGGLIVTMGFVFTMALALPNAWDAQVAGLSAALLSPLPTS